MSTNEMVYTSLPREPALIRQLPMVPLLVLHLVPGALMTAAFVALAPFAETAGLPPIAALLMAIAAVLLPFEFAVVLWAGRGSGSILAAVPYREPIRTRRWLWLVPSLIVVAFLGFGLHQAIEPALIDGLFGWLPDWFRHPIATEQVGAYPPSAWIVTLVSYIALNGIAGPVVEELYFRGYLLPRMERFGRWAPLVNVSLFSLYHFWSPWQLLARIVAIAPMAYAVRWTRNVYVGMVVHGTLNLLGILLVTMVVLPLL